MVTKNTIFSAAVLGAVLLISSQPSCALAGESADGLSEKELKTISDMSIIDEALATQADSTDPPGLPDTWMSVGELVASTPAFGMNLPKEDGWGNPFLVKTAWYGVMILSRGPNGAFDDREAVEKILSERFSSWSCFNPVQNDDLLFFDGELVKGPRTLKGKWMIDLSDLRTLSTAAAAYADDHGNYPETRGRVCDVSELEDSLLGRYLRRVPTIDVWGNPFKAYSTGDHLMLIGCGADGVPDQDYSDADPEKLLQTLPNEFTDRRSDIVVVDRQYVAYPKGSGSW